MSRGHHLRRRLVRSLGHHWPTVQRVLPRRPLPYPTRVGLLWLDLGDSTASIQRVLRVYEPKKFDNVSRFLPPGGTFVDVGANMGDFSVWAAKRGGAGVRVLAVEADPDNVTRLERNVRQHKLEATIRIVPKAAAAAAGTIQLHQGHTSGQSTIAPSAVHELDHLRPRGTVDIPAERLDDILTTAGIDRVDVLKIDVEGAEELVLAGAEQLIGSGKPLTMLIDLHWGVDVAGITRRLQAAGFTIRGEEQPDDVLETVPDTIWSIVCVRS